MVGQKRASNLMPYLTIMVWYALLKSTPFYYIFGFIYIEYFLFQVTMMDNLKDRFQKWKISHINDLTGEHMVAFRKFGHKVSI